MKKNLLLIFTIASLSFTACNSNDEPTFAPGTDNFNAPGAYIVNAGQYSGNLIGTLGFYNYSDKSYSPDVFYSINKSYVGDTFNCGFISGSYIYLAVTDSKVIHVVDINTLKLVKTISTSSYNGGPRYFTEYNGYVYVTIFGESGLLCRINPGTLTIDSNVAVGPYPEQTVTFNGNIYVAVSDGYNYENKNQESAIAIINPDDLSIVKKLTGVINPVQLSTNGQKLFVEYNGWYDYDPATYTSIQKDYGISEIVNGDEISETIAEGNYMAINGNLLYYIDAGWGKPEKNYYVYDIATHTSTEWISSSQGVFDPTGNGIFVDNVTGDVFLISNYENEYGYGSYDTPGYVKMFSADGTLKNQFTVGIGPTSIFFNYK